MNRTSPGRLLAVTLIVTALLTVSAGARVLPVQASGNNNNWHMTFSGGLVDAQGIPFYGFPPGTGFMFSGSCALAGVSFGSDGVCQVANVIHIPGSNSSITCQTAINVTAWDDEPNIYFPNIIDFFFTSGHVSVAPSPLTVLCLEMMFPPGTVDPNTGNFIAPFDSGFGASPGHTSINVHYHVPQLIVTEFQQQVTFTP